MGEKNSTAVEVARFIAAHDGVITRPQAEDLGMTRNEVYRRAESGLWVPHGPSAYLSAEHLMTDMARVRIAEAAHGGVMDRTAAGWLHGLLPTLPDEVTLSVPRSAHGSKRCDVPTRISRRTFPTEDLTTVRGIRTIGLALALLMLSALLEEGIDVMDRTLQRKLISLKELHSALDRNAGLPGMRRARQILESADDLSESELERKFVRFLRKHKIGGWQQQVWFGGHRIDFVFPELQIAVQMHGWAFHHQHDRWERDQQLANLLVNAGWHPLIFTWRRLVDHPDDVLRELREAIEIRTTVA